MKTCRSILLCLLLFPVVVFSQWTWQNPLPQGNILHAVVFTNAQTGFAVGNWGTMLKTTDGGAHWQLVPEIPHYQFEYIWFLDPLNGWITGEAPHNGGPGIIMHTSDGGVTWDLQWSAGSSVSGIFFTDPQHGFAVGDLSGGHSHLMKTADGGMTWQLQPHSLFPEFLATVQFVNDSTGWVGGADGIYKTTNAGGTWVKQCDIFISCMCFPDENSGYAAGPDGKIMQTTNGGSSWTVSTNVASYVSRMCFVNKDTGWVIGGGSGPNFILKTTNGGANWVQETSGTACCLLGIAFQDDLTGWITGCGGTMLKTENAGLDWQNTSSSLTYSTLNRVQCLDENNGFTAGGGTILKTINGGAAWARKFTDTAYILNSLSFISSGTGWIVGSACHTSNPFQGIVLKTTDAGEHWTNQTISPMHGLLGCHFENENTGWVVGKGSGSQSGEIYKTTDGGSTWVLQLSDNLSECTDVSFSDLNHGWVVRLSDRLSRTSDGGTTWTTKTVGSGQYLFNTLLINQDTGWVTGWYTVAKSVNGGASWDWQLSMDVYDLCFINADTGWAVGGMYPGAIVKTTDGGTTWTGLDCVTDFSFSGVSFINADVGWVVGPNGCIIKTTNGGGFPVSIEEPAQTSSTIKIYPNPASGAINIELPAMTGDVELSVFDLTGKVVLTRRIEGTKTQLDIGDLPAGVLFVRVTGDKTVQVGKFVKQ